MAPGCDNKSMRFRIGAVPIEFSTSSRRLLNQYASLYGRFLSSEDELSSTVASTPHESWIRVHVEKEPFRPWRRRRYEVRVNNQTLFRPTYFRELLSHIEWAITWDVPRALPQFLQLHAATLERDGQGVIFPGASGNGKSTLAVGLVTHGWNYLCDEFALIHCESLDVHPYPRAICVKESAFPVLHDLGIREISNRDCHAGPKGKIRLLNPEEIRVGAVGGVCPVRFIIFPKYSANASPAIVPLSRPEAVSMLHAVCFNLLKCQRLGLDVLTEVVRGARCYRLISGDIRQTCKLVNQVVSQGDGLLAQTG